MKAPEEVSADRPWEQLESIAESGDAKQLEEYLDSLGPSEVARALAHLSVADQSLVIGTLGPEEAADLIDEVPVAQAAALVEHLATDVGLATAMLPLLLS